jgi:hypothetical protein
MGYHNCEVASPQLDRPSYDLSNDMKVKVIILLAHRNEILLRLVRENGNGNPSHLLYG